MKRSCTIFICNTRFATRSPRFLGATVPPPYGGEIPADHGFYVDPLKLAKRMNWSPMDVVRATNTSNPILPAWRCADRASWITTLHYQCAVSSRSGMKPEFIPTKRKGINRYFRCPTWVIHGRRRAAIQQSPTGWTYARNDRMDVAMAKAGRHTTTRLPWSMGSPEAIKTLRDIPAQLCKAHVVFDQSLFVQAGNLRRWFEGIGWFLDADREVLIFLGSFRATVAVLLSIPISVMIVFFVLYTGNRSIDSMVLSGLALAFSRLIDNSVVVLENIFRHIEHGEDPGAAAVNGANEVVLPVLAITLIAVVVFFPVTFLACSE